ncbi:MAG TPA: multicopper oxidase [Candidatus Angelobacter sp.]|nr:multicopper oxidase [Candidatus Angelobacter sp.]
MFITRRTFLKHSAIAALAAYRNVQHDARVGVRPVLDPNTLAQFVDPLPIPALARSNGLREHSSNSGVKIPYYRLAMRQVKTKVHRDLQPTRMWGFGSGSPGPTLETRSGQGLWIEWVNDLPRTHFLPIDRTLHGAEPDKPEVRTVVHLHGAKAPPESDGYPESWHVPGQSALYYYPNDQDAAMLWYHDHTLGINRLNVYAGLLGVFFVRDTVEDSLNLPSGKYEIPLVIYDRMFDRQGQLYYPISDNPKSPWIPEFAGDAMLVNGKLFPYLDVEPRKYRFRLLNGANARFFNLSLSNGQAFHQIGTDQGLLPSPVSIERLSIAPGERADLIIDFAGRSGEKIVMSNEAVTVMQFRVSPRVAADTSSLPSVLRPVKKLAESEAIKTRMLTLVEVDDPVGRPTQMLLNDAHWNMPVTENPTLDSVEIWSLINLSDDSHPIHLHLVRFQILDRRRFDRFTYLNEGRLLYTGPVTPPAPNEAGWKDTVRADAGMVTRIIARFEGFKGRYVWHCHILEHEDNEMMRPFDVIAGELR